MPKLLRKAKWHHITCRFWRFRHVITCQRFSEVLVSDYGLFCAHLRQRLGSVCRDVYIRVLRQSLENMHWQSPIHRQFKSNIIARIADKTVQRSFRKIGIICGAQSDFSAVVFRQISQNARRCLRILRHATAHSLVCIFTELYQNRIRRMRIAC